MITKKTALQYHKAGFHVIPVTSNKTPACKNWKQYQTAQTAGDIDELWQQDSWGIAILTGIDGLEVIDVDQKHDVEGGLMLRYQKHNDKYNDESISFAYLTVTCTPNDGYHIYYKCDKIQGNQKLASRPATAEELQQHNATAKRKKEDPDQLPQVLIETRGTGGYVLAPPTPGYEVQYGKLSKVQHITQEQRFNLLRNAQYFNTLVKSSDIDYKAARQTTADYEGKPSWEVYNEKADAIALLEQHGWKQVYQDKFRVYLKRPGNTSAKTSGNYHREKGIFVCHSTSTVFEAEKGYTPYAIYATLEHNGDFSAAAKALYQQGYGTAKKVQQLPAGEQHKQEKKEESIDNLLAFVKSTRFDIRQPIKEDEAILTSTIDGETYKLAGKGMIASIVGEQKSGKSLITSAFTAAGLSGRQVLSFDLNLQDGNAIFFDTEQPRYFYQKTQERIYKMARLYDNHPKYEAYQLRRLAVEDRIKAIDAILQGRQDLSYIVIDGIVDLCKDFNSESEAKRTIERLMHWSDETGALIVTVLHLTKSQGFMRGHLGTELQNKHDLALQVSIDEETGFYEVRHRDSRFKPFKGFTFQRDDKGLPVMDNDAYPIEEQPDYYTPSAYQQPTAASSSVLVSKTAGDDDVPF
jgi:hypothetical protein